MAEGQKHILVIEDNNAMLQLYSQVFSGTGFKVSTAADGETGWAKIQSEHPDLILLDMVIPKLSGADLLKKLHDDPTTAKIPVVVFSAVNSAENVRKALDAGASEFLPKATSSPKSVVSKIQAVLEKANRKPLLCPNCGHEVPLP